MSKKFFLVIFLFFSTAILSDVISIPKRMVQTAWVALYSCKKRSCTWVLSHKYTIFIAGTMVAGASFIYKSEKLQKFLKELIGLEVRKPRHYIIPTRPAKNTKQ